MGPFNSSATRVKPVFDRLLERDSSGADWISDVLRTMPHGARLAAALSAPGTLLDDGKPRFEYPAPPSDAFLWWLIRHPERMTWPIRSGVEVRYGESTQTQRERLFGRRGASEQQAAQGEALAELDRRSASRSARQWWAFEGVTKVDFCIQTERLVIFVEGKRTEKLTASNDWFAQRSQLVRNMEVVGAVAGDRPCGVLLAVEDPLPELDDQTLKESTPHLDADERAEVAARYLGQVLWRDLCGAVDIDYESLPYTLP